MSNKTLKIQIPGILLAVLTIMVTAGFSIDAHYCQGNLKDISLFGQAKTCQSDVVKSHCGNEKSHCKKKIEKTECEKGCCDNEQIIIDSPDDLIQSQIVSFNYQPEVTAITIAILKETSQVISIPKAEYLNFKPPLSGKAKRTLYQTFLI